MTLEVRELTPPGAGAVSVVSVRGPGARARVSLLAGGRLLRLGRATLLELADEAGPLDEALALALGEERVELHLHGSRPIVRRVLEVLRGVPLEGDRGAGPGGGPPGREGEAGELEERAWRALQAAPCEAAARVLLDQAEGALRRALEDLRAAPAAERSVGARALAALGRRLGPLFQPARIVLAGPVNAGKSTLFNALVGSERVIVAEQPGTTRDRIVERAQLGAYAVDLCDTAGERGVPGAGGAAALERRGQELARRERARADLVLLLQPADGASPPALRLPAERAVLVFTRGDLARRTEGPTLAALPDPEGARRVVEKVFLEALDLLAEPWLPGRAVPFEAELCRTLEDAAAAGAQALEATIAGLLAGRAARQRPDPRG